MLLLVLIGELQSGHTVAHQRRSCCFIITLMPCSLRRGRGAEGQKRRTEEDEVQGSRKDVYDSIIASRYPSVILLPHARHMFSMYHGSQLLLPYADTHTHLHTPTQEKWLDTDHETSH